eukprot:CAMPEP_0201495438 /NCGR_PEP_ID=MMETSP0151_2-20130828/53983_1 /ASSEMBLY_ACC=CAM_ASM_000257 /TAXON_ID=200890 /ORGANISM="Paramoeba atlantica, Strain 621/1 / CCAP 1560/9" /LENGTH=225 /DNA_ID=CAMNT_0047884467 /DNA_START=141 /DNA_END=818 /DNA_ORIENTATION=+
MDGELFTMVEKHMLRSICHDVSSLFLSSLLSIVGVQVENITLANRTKLLEHLNPEDQKTLKALFSVTTVSSFLEQLQKTTEHLQFHLKSLDKKTERVVVFTHKKNLLLQLEEEKQPEEQRFQAFVLLLSLSWKNCLPHAPPKALPLLLDWLEKDRREREEKGEGREGERDVLCKAREFNDLWLRKLIEKDEEKQKEIETGLKEVWVALKGLYDQMIQSSKEKGEK